MSRELIMSITLADCEVQRFRAGGKGGQNQNKRDTGVRVIHRPSGASAESRTERSQYQNTKAAFRRMAESAQFRLWLNRELWIRSGLPDPEAQAEADMAPGNIKVEYRVSGRWEEQADD